MEEIDIILALHMNLAIETGKLVICSGYSHASSRHFTVEIEGVSAHAASAHTGIDALAASVRFYESFHIMVNREISTDENYVCSISYLQSGTSFNIVPDKVVIKGTVRSFDVGLSKFLFERIKSLAEGVSHDTWAKITVTGSLKSVPLYNNPALVEMMIESMKKVVGEDGVQITKKGYGSEDFSLIVSEKSGLIFRLGTKNDELGSNRELHHSDFLMDEESLQYG